MTPQATRSEFISAFDAEARAFEQAFREAVECGHAFVDGEIAQLTRLAATVARDVEAWRLQVDELHARHRSLRTGEALEAILECVFDDHLFPEAVRLLSAGIALARA